MRQSAPVIRARRRGAAIVTTLFVLLIISILLIGVGANVTSHNQRAVMDASHAAAIDVAEAGVNYEFRKISADEASADQQAAPYTGSIGPGSFRVYCTSRDGGAWTPPADLYVYSTGTVNGVSRTVRVAAKGYPPEGDFAIYSMNGTSVFNGSAILIDGDVGTNGYFDFNGHPGVNGDVYFCGPAAGWSGGDPGGYVVQYTPKAVEWETVEEAALRLFPPGTYPPGGLAYLALVNDNLKSGIIGNRITDSVTLIGPGNYYVTEIDLTGSKKITFNNLLGPINLWVGPEGGSGTCRFRGGTAALSLDKGGAPIHIYVATTTGIDLAGNEVLDASINAYNRRADGTEYGYMVNSGNPIINGQVISNTIDINGNITVNYKPGLNSPTSVGYYGYDNSWVEINPR